MTDVSYFLLQLDVTSAFIARASKKQQAQLTAKTKNGPSQTGPQARELREEKSQYELFGSHVSIANGTEKISKNAMVEPQQPVAGTRDEYVIRREEKQGNLQVPTLNGTSAATFNGPVPVLHATNSAPTSKIPEVSIPLGVHYVLLVTISYTGIYECSITNSSKYTELHPRGKKKISIVIHKINVINRCSLFFHHGRT